MRKMSRKKELSVLVEECLLKRGYLICVASIDNKKKLSFTYIKRDFFNIDVYQTMKEFDKMLYMDMEGFLVDEKRGVKK